MKGYSRNINLRGMACILIILGLVVGMSGVDGAINLGNVISRFENAWGTGKASSAGALRKFYKDPRTIRDMISGAGDGLCLLMKKTLVKYRIVEAKFPGRYPNYQILKHQYEVSCK